MEGKFISRRLLLDDDFAMFYLLAKVHKTPLKTWPNISASRSILYGIGCWLDTQLRIIINNLKYVCRSSTTFINEIKNIPIKNNYQFFTCDAKSMYTNIDTTHAFITIEIFLTTSSICDDNGLNKNAIISALHIIMQHNLFQFGDTFWLQLSGTAMGTPPAPMYATLYFFIHEEKIIPKY